jgi:hypothetical protein
LLRGPAREPAERREVALDRANSVDEVPGGVLGLRPAGGDAGQHQTVLEASGAAMNGRPNGGAVAPVQDRHVREPPNTDRYRPEADDRVSV